MLSQAEGKSKFRNLGEGEKLTQSLVKKHYILMGPREQQSVDNYETRNGYLEGPCLALSWANKGSIHESGLSPTVDVFFVISFFPEDKLTVRFITHLFSRSTGLR